MKNTVISIPYEKSNFDTMADFIDYVSAELSQKIKKLRLTAKQRKETRVHLVRATKEEVAYSIVEFHETSVMKEGK